MLQEIVVGKSCGKILQEIVVGNFFGKLLLFRSCGKVLWENLAGKSWRKFLGKILAGQGGGEKANLRKAVIGGHLAFGIG